jgi:hypothetical protein
VPVKYLELNDSYSRKEIHRIFSPQTKFTPQAGTWGLHGIIKIPNRERDFVFIVTYGQSQGEHNFDEGITADGVLSWQSQPRQDLSNKIIIQLINHDDITDNIYLFLREDKKSDYKYLGKLAYLDHDTQREMPVYFQWQLLDWDEMNNGITSEETSIGFMQPKEPKPKKLEMVDLLPTKQKREGTDTQSFRARKSPDYAKRDSTNRKLGLDGELLVIEFEQNRLNELGLDDLSREVVHTSVVQGDGAGYDILSFNEDGTPRYIEVKTTRGSLNTDFYMSPNEINFSEKHPDNFFLYRVYDFGSENSAKFFIIKGNVNNQLIKTPVNFRMSFAR